MKQIVLLSFVAFAATMAFAMTNLERYRLKAVAERPRCESRRPVVIGGVTNIVETWRRGPYTWSQTNAVRQIVGKVQTNTFAQQIGEWKSKWAAATNSLSLAEARLAIAEAKAERADRLKTWLEEQRDKAILDSTKKLYQAIIDRLNGGGQ